MLGGETRNSFLCVYLQTSGNSTSWWRNTCYVGLCLQARPRNSLTHQVTAASAWSRRDFFVTTAWRSLHVRCIDQMSVRRCRCLCPVDFSRCSCDDMKYKKKGINKMYLLKGWVDFLKSDAGVSDRAIDNNGNSRGNIVMNGE